MDILQAERGAGQGWTNKINRKHVDFLLCDEKWMTPQLIIELDDRSHERAERQERDRFLDQACAAAGLAILHTPVRETWRTTELRNQIFAALHKDKTNQPRRA